MNDSKIASAPDNVVPLPKREPSGGADIMPNVTVRTIGSRQEGSPAQIVVVSSGFGTIREVAAPQGRGSGSLRINSMLAAA
ncbi:hypothetical protein [Paenibacillus sp. MBLB4367]|uniref:hypothetical protein n=1 Tax=Paenibacillus sp. MBLB4367 TaxID=3384767 RepID=UPI003907FB03